MATKVTEVDELTSCPVCFGDFSEETPHVPRILPCFHTLCEYCVEQLLQNSSLECPECREKHEAPKGVKTFQQNKYIIAHIRNNRKSPQVVAPRERKQCPDHGEQLIMFCRESGCQIPICHLCLIKSHKFHDFVDLEQERKENYRCLVKDMEEVSKKLRENKKEIRSVQEDFEKNYEKSLKKLKLRKEEIIRKITEHMNKLEEKLNQNKTDQDTKIQNEMETIEIITDLMQNMQDNMKEPETLEDIKIKREIFNKFCEELHKRNTNRKSFSFLEYNTDQLSANTLEHLCGKTIKREIPLTFSEGEFLDHKSSVGQNINRYQNPLAANRMQIKRNRTKNIHIKRNKYWRETSVSSKFGSINPWPF